MLAHHESDTVGPLDHPLFARSDAAGDTAAGAGASGEDASGENAVIGQRVGVWRVTGLLGRGGMGSVYRAERDDETFHQRAALKLVHPRLGHDFRERFLRERSLLAGLDHPGVARLLDGGLDASGAPFLAMELVDGGPLTDYADARGLDLRQRLALFVQACDAVAHAHLHLIVHRDLKPPHILVEDAEGGPRVKLLDFGIAKLLSEEDPSLTRTGASGPLTPSYAAPEQVRGEAITTATDVYALGLVLYELLAGSRPYSLDGLRAAQVERVICEAVPLAPSAVAAPEAARALRGDLDTIALKALAKEPARRYPTAAGLAADLRRYLGGLPVEARPATAAYRTATFLRRHRVLASAAAAATVLLIAVVAGFTIRLSAERDRARDEAATAKAVTDFLTGTFAEASPTVGPALRPSEMKLTDALRLGLRSADTAFTARPAVRAALMQTLGRTFLDLGLYDDAAPPLREALRLREVIHARGPDPEKIETVDALALLAMWRPDLGDADALFTRSLSLRSQIYGPRSEEAAIGMANLAENAIEHDDYGRALGLLREARAIIAEGPGERSVAGGEVLFVFAVGSLRGGRLDDADAAFADLYAFARSLVASGAVSEDDDRIATILIGYGQTRLLLGHTEDAAPLFREALGRRAARYDPGHPSLAEAQSLAAISLLDTGRYADAERLLLAARPGLASGDPYTETRSIARIDLAWALAAQGRPVDTDTVQNDLATVRLELGPDHGWSRYAARRLAQVDRARR